jgi:hypothetical protein
VKGKSTSRKEEGSIEYSETTDFQSTRFQLFNLKACYVRFERYA